MKRSKQHTHPMLLTRKKTTWQPEMLIYHASITSTPDATSLFLICRISWGLHKLDLIYCCSIYCPPTVVSCRIDGWTCPSTADPLFVWESNSCLSTGDATTWSWTEVREGVSAAALNSREFPSFSSLLIDFLVALTCLVFSPLIAEDNLVFSEGNLLGSDFLCGFFGWTGETPFTGLFFAACSSRLSLPVWGMSLWPSVSKLVEFFFLPSLGDLGLVGGI